MSVQLCGRAVVATLMSVSVACAPEPPEDRAANEPSRLVGTWRAVLLSPGGDLPFTLEISEDAGRISAVAVNGEERAPFSNVDLIAEDVTLAFDGYDSRIEATLVSDETMRGRWQKTVPGGVSSLDFVATRGAGERFLPIHETRSAGGVINVSGVWHAAFTDEDGTEQAQGEFHQVGSRVLGTFLTPTGDYRFLDGSFESGLLRLSTFDGAHAFLFHARAADDGTLVGDFWSRDSYHATWTASPAEDGAAILPDSWSLAGLTNDDGRFRFSFDDLSGQKLSHDDPVFAGKVVIANIFGSWCPNCNDKAPLLADWYRRYRTRGLEIVGLAFEFSGNAERDRLYVQKFADRHGIEFPLLLAGTSDKQEAAEILPDLTAVIAFPTSVFIDREGRVRRIHTGFSGPGTGAHYHELVAELEHLIEELLREPVPA